MSDYLKAQAEIIRRLLPHLPAPTFSAPVNRRVVTIPMNRSADELPAAASGTTAKWPTLAFLIGDLEFELFDGISTETPPATSFRVRQTGGPRYPSREVVLEFVLKDIDTPVRVTASDGDEIEVAGLHEPALLISLSVELPRADDEEDE